MFRFRSAARLFRYAMALPRGARRRHQADTFIRRHAPSPVWPFQRTLGLRLGNRVCGPASGILMYGIATHPVRWVCADNVFARAVGAASIRHLTPLFTGLITHSRNPTPHCQSTGLCHDDPDHDTVSLCKEPGDYAAGWRRVDRIERKYFRLRDFNGLDGPLPWIERVPLYPPCAGLSHLKY
jgi:hypothetical protein